MLAASSNRCCCDRVCCGAPWRGRPVGALGKGRPGSTWAGGIAKITHHHSRNMTFEQSNYQLYQGVRWGTPIFVSTPGLFAILNKYYPWPKYCLGQYILIANMNCRECSKLCACNCGSVETHTEIILYPVSQQMPRQSKSFTVKQFGTVSRTTRLSETFEGIGRLREPPSSAVDLKKTKITAYDDAEEKTVPQQVIEDKQNTQLNLQRRKQSIHEHLKVISVHPSHRSSLASPCSTLRENGMTVRLLERENTQLKLELEHLKREEIELLNFQTKMRERNNRQVSKLKQRSLELERKSLKRREEIRQVSELLLIARRQNGKRGRARRGVGAF